MSVAFVDPSRVVVGDACISLLQGFGLRRDERALDVPTNAQRLLAYLALRRRPQHRAVAAGTLWGDSSEARAAGNLRTALWQVRKLGDDLITTSSTHIEIGATVTTDVQAMMQLTDELDRARIVAIPPECFDQFAGGILPEWYDDWVTIERERYRQIGFHLLEDVSARLSAAGHHVRAIQAALAVVAVEPLRETAQRTLIQAHLAEGNSIEAVRQFRSFRQLLVASLGIEPSRSLRALVDHLDG